MKYKKAQISKTLMWIVATIIIIIILAVSIIITTILPKRTYKDVPSSKEADLFATKSLTSYLLTEDDSGKNVFEEIKEQEDLNDFNGNLAVKIFRGLYEKDYHPIWFGIDFEGFSLERGNIYFEVPSNIKGGDINWKHVSFISEEIKLNENKYLRLVLINK